MTEAAGGNTFRALAVLTSHNNETVRRYMQGQAPSVEFVTAFCSGLDINIEWLLTGAGPMKRSELKSQTLRDANPTELLSAIAGGLEQVSQRLERLEMFVQSLEARVRAQLTAIESQGKAKRKIAKGGASDGQEARAVGPTERARIVAGALSRGPHAHAD